VIFKSEILNRYKPWLSISIAVALAVCFLPSEGILFPFFVFCMGLFIGIFFIRLLPEADRDFLVTLFLAAFLLRIVAALFFYNAIFLRNGTGMVGDAWPYSQSGYEILKMWMMGIRDHKVIYENMMKVTASGTLSSYDYWNAVVYFFTGKSPLSVIFINCLAGSLAVVFIYFITKQIKDIRAAKIAALLTAFWPSTFMWSIQNFKEPISIFLIVALAWAILSLRVRFRFYLIFLVFILSVALKEMRLVSFTVFYILVIPASLFLLTLRSKKPELIFPFLLIILVAFLSFGAIKLYIAKYIPFFPAKGNVEFLKWAQAMRSVRATGGTAFLVNWDICNPLVLMLFIPAALSIAWLAPFPWQLGSVQQIMAVPEMIIYYMLIPFMFSGYRFVMKNKPFEGGIITVYVFIMMVILAFIEGNIGTLFRHRAMVMPFLFILIAVGSDRHRIRITI